MKNQAEIYDALNLLSIVLNQPQDSKRLEFYATSLKDFDLNSVLRQIKQLSYSAKFFPQLVEIIEPLQGTGLPSEELATQLASRVIESISMFGELDTAGVKKHLGDVYQLVERFGGWGMLSMIKYSEIPATRAQLRELAKAYINQAKREGSPVHFQVESTPKKGELKLIKF